METWARELFRELLRAFASAEWVATRHCDEEVHGLIRCGQSVTPVSIARCGQLVSVAAPDWWTGDVWHLHVAGDGGQVRGEFILADSPLMSAPGGVWETISQTVAEFCRRAGLRPPGG